MMMASPMKTDLLLIITLLSIALMGGLAATDVFSPAAIPPTGFTQHIRVGEPQ